MVCSFAVASPLAGQALVSGTLEGTVRDATGRPLFGVTITITNHSTGRRYLLRTDRAGRYAITFLAAGRYDALFERLGFDPDRIEDIVVPAGERRDVSVSLRPTQGSAVTPRVRAADAALAAAAQSGPDRWLTGTRGAASLPFDDRDITAAAATSSMVGSRLDMEGLPAWLGTLVIDGIPSVQRPSALGLRARAAAFPLSSLALAEIVTTSSDVERPGTASGYFNGYTRGAAGTASIEAFGDFGADALAIGATDVAAFQTYRAGARFGGPIVRDTAGFLIGVEYLKSELPYRALWAPDSGTARVESTARGFGVDLTRYARPAVEMVERIAGFARLDLLLGQDHTLSIRGLAASLPTTAFHAPWTEQPVGAESVEKFTELFAATTLVSRLAEGAGYNDLNIGFELSRSDRGQPPASGADDPPETIVLRAARGFGSVQDRTTDSEIWSLYARNTLHLSAGSHRFKLGIATTFPSYDVTRTFARAGEFLYSGADEFALRRGYYAGHDGVASRGDWNERRITFFGQDSWKPTPDLELIAGVRFELFGNADSISIRRDTRWDSLSGLSNRMLERRNFDLAPRFAMTWRPAGQGLVMATSAYVDATPISSAIMAEIFTRNGSYNARRGFGVADWPSAPDTTIAHVEGPVLALLGPQFQGPRTSRLNGSITKSIGAGVALTLSANHRKTEFLPQRKDLNRLVEVTGRDQFGRPIYGQLRKEGALLFADGESNRRFPEFDQVWGLQATGVSTYRGLTITAERPLRGGVGVFASYTYSKTEDDWMVGERNDPRTQISPFPDSLNGQDWVKGRSDFDVPHRAVAGIELQAAGRFAPRIAAIYRYQSGYPFTPGFRDGVDANGDGSPRNDPAFVDDRITGIAELVNQWPCLSSQIGRFAERNACRAPDLNALDARLTVSFMQGERYAAELVIDALNLIASKDGVIDRALYLLDPARDLTVGPQGRNVTVPLVVNPGFGSMLARYAPERMFRLGLRLRY